MPPEDRATEMETPIVEDEFQQQLRQALKPILSGRCIIFADSSYLSSAAFAISLGADVRVLLPENWEDDLGLGSVALRALPRVSVNRTPEFWADAITQKGPISKLLDVIDPRGNAVVLLPSAAETLPDQRIHGRECWGGRRAHWRSLEDKTVSDGTLLIPAGIPVPNAMVLGTDSSHRSLAQAFESVRSDRGVVLSANMDSGLAAAASGVRYALTQQDVIARYEEFRQAEATAVRVAAFTGGRSIGAGGTVFRDGSVSTAPPIEHYSLLGPNGRIVFAGYGSAAVLTKSERNLVRAYAEAAGQAANTAVGYAGTFSLDLIVGDRGVFANEFNARYSAGPDRHARYGGIPWALANAAISSGKIWQGDSRGIAPTLTRAVTVGAMEHPWTSPPAVHLDRRFANSSHPYTLVGDRWIPADPHDPQAVTVQIAGSGVIALHAGAALTSSHDLPPSYLVHQLFQQVAQDAEIPELGALELAFDGGRIAQASPPSSLETTRVDTYRPHPALADLSVGLRRET